MPTTPQTPNPLGPRQRAVLDALTTRKYWHAGCGWAWRSDKTTRVVLDSLVDRGVVRIDESLTVYNRRVYLPVDQPKLAPQVLPGSVTAGDVAAIELLRRSAAQDVRALTLNRAELRAVLRMAEYGYTALASIE